jgi:hypothetical protein
MFLITLVDFSTFLSLYLEYPFDSLAKNDPTD